MNHRKIHHFLKPAILMPMSIVALMIVGQNSARANTKSSLYLAQTPQLPPGTNVDDLPNSPLPDNQKDPGFNPLPPIEDFLETPPNQLPNSGSSESSVEFKIKQFKLNGNTVLEESAVEAIVKDYRNRPITCLLYTSPSPRDGLLSRMPSSA